MKQSISRIGVRVLALAIIGADVCLGAVLAGGESGRSMVTTAWPAPEASGFATSNSWSALNNEVLHLGKPQWRPLLAYVASLHEKSTHPATYPLSAKTKPNSHDHE